MSDYLSDFFLKESAHDEAAHSEAEKDQYAGGGAYLLYAAGHSDHSSDR